ncbi:MAG: hypothetical protein EOP84_20500 [Verrucomicrobiaceae bacterium]|nr:MAG: hypothetical protein EOP84_20500 [Verrucomicrobiaceae bacterium]
MKRTRHFRDGDCFWKFEDGRRPQRKTGASAKWEDSFFRGLGEFLMDPGTVREIGPEDAGTLRRVHRHDLQLGRPSRAMCEGHLQSAWGETGGGISPVLVEGGLQPAGVPAPDLRKVRASAENSEPKTNMSNNASNIKVLNSLLRAEISTVKM